MKRRVETSKWISSYIMHVNTHLEGATVEWIRYGYHLKTLRLRQVHSLGRITDLSKYSHSSFSFSEISFLGDRIGESLIGPISWILFLNESCLFRAVLYESRSKPIVDPGGCVDPVIAWSHTGFDHSITVIAGLGYLDRSRKEDRLEIHSQKLIIHGFCLIKYIFLLVRGRESP